MRLRFLPATIACVVVLAACGGGSDDAKKPQAGLAGGATTTVGPFDTTSDAQTRQGPPIGKIRIANLISLEGKPGPAIDVYDTNKPASTDVALIKDLRYGQVSDYVTPHGGTQYDTRTNLYVFPAGSLTTTQLLSGSNIDNSGFEAGDQLTLGLFAGTTGSGLGSVTMDEAGSRVPSGTDPQPPAGKASVILRDVADSGTDVPVHDLAFNGKCPDTDGDASTVPVTVDNQTFTVAPGTYTLGVATSPPGHALRTCQGQPETTTTTVAISTGQRIDAFIYGDPKAPSIVTAAVA